MTLVMRQDKQRQVSAEHTGMNKPTAAHFMQVGGAACVTCELGWHDAAQDNQMYRRNSGPTAPPMSGDWKAYLVPPPHPGGQQGRPPPAPVAMNAQTGFAYSPLQHGQMTR